MHESATTAIAIYSDYVCPFCYLGRESLAQYEATRGTPLAIDWHPFDLRASERGPDGSLDPDAESPKDDDYFDQVRENVAQLQDRYDVEMAQPIATDVDSLDAQQASMYVQTEHPEQWRDFDEAIFDALWLEGRDIGDPDELAAIADDVGLDPAAVRAALDDETLRERLESQFAAAKDRGITGVPTFVVDGHAARGAVPPEHLRRLVEGE